MKPAGQSQIVKLGAAGISAMLLLVILVLTPAPEASAQGSSPCPHFSIHDVFADPNGNWDGDQVNNADELYNGLNPCIADTAEYCAGGGIAICRYPAYGHLNYPTACQAAINANPHGDYDGDGISNAVEILNGANPCAHPCPYPTGIDLALNPNGDWDNDGTSNALEVNQGTNPCDRYRYNPCPYYSLYQVKYMPHLDWDGDGIDNLTEIYNGTNPCIANVVRYVPYVTYVPKVTQRLPHVVVKTPVYVAPVRPICPWNYPYYHVGNGLCYANPVKPFW